MSLSSLEAVSVKAIPDETGGDVVAGTPLLKFK